MTSDFRFEGVIKKVEKFQKDGVESVYMRCCEIGYECLQKFGDKPKKNVIYNEEY